MKKTEPEKTKWVIAIEKKLKPQKVFFEESRCCGDAWFMDYNYFNDDLTLNDYCWRIQHNLKLKKIKLIKFSHGLRHVNNFSFSCPRQLFLFLKTHFNLPK